MNSASSQNLFIMWLKWHFYQAPKFLFSVWENYLYFTLEFFSIPLLLKTLFSPWRKYIWGWPKSFNIAEYFNIFVSNMFSRLIGAVLRLFLIIFGLFFLIGVLLAGFILFITWILLPFISILILLIPFLI